MDLLSRAERKLLEKLADAGKPTELGAEDLILGKILEDRGLLLVVRNSAMGVITPRGRHALSGAPTPATGTAAIPGRSSGATGPAYSLLTASLKSQTRLRTRCHWICQEAKGCQGLATRSRLQPLRENPSKAARPRRRLPQIPIRSRQWNRLRPDTPMATPITLTGVTVDENCHFAQGMATVRLAPGT